MGITQEAETRKPMTIWADVRQKLRNSPNESKNLTKPSLFLSKLSSVEVKISTDGKSPTLLYKMLLNWILNYNFVLIILV